MKTEFVLLMEPDYYHYSSSDDIPWFGHYWDLTELPNEATIAKEVHGIVLVEELESEVAIYFDTLENMAKFQLKYL